MRSGSLLFKNSYLNTDCKNRVLANIPNSTYNLYIKQGTDSNGEYCNSSHSGFKFGIAYNNEDGAYPSCGIGNMRGELCIYLSFGMMHHYDSSTNTSNWICTVYNGKYTVKPIAILINSSSTMRINGNEMNAGVYILSAPDKIYGLNEIIPDSYITVTKLG